jgi:GR25 family glycosyltransferase involved in LPS biosynthesis
MMAIEGRRPIVEYVAQHIPNLEVTWERGQGAMDTFLRHLRSAGNDPIVRMEDDIILTKGFMPAILAAIEEHPDNLIQFFTRHKENSEQGSRWMAGSTFSWNQCSFMPAGMAGQVADFYDEPLWQERRYEHPTGLDNLVCDWLTTHRQKYWLHNPSLVQHARTVSAIDRRRARNRHTKFVAELEYDGFPTEYLP